MGGGRHGLRRAVSHGMQIAMVYLFHAAKLSKIFEYHAIFPIIFLREDVPMA